MTEEKKITREDLRTMAPEKIEEARQAGRLDHLLEPKDDKAS